MKEDLRVVKNEEVVNEELNKDKDENKFSKNMRMNQDTRNNTPIISIKKIYLILLLTYKNS